MTDTLDNDLTIIYYTANTIPRSFALNTEKQLLKAMADSRLQWHRPPLISISHIPMLFGDNKVVDLPQSHFNIYRQALIGAKVATTKWIALCEDDELYSPEHFKYRPKSKPFAYNLGYWGIYTWREPMFHYKGRRNLGNLICEREAFIEAMEERFAKYPNPDPNDQHLKDIWAEPGKYERQLGVTQRETESFYTLPPNIKFSHQTELSFAGLGTRKRAGDLQALELPYWGTADYIRSLYA